MPIRIDHWVKLGSVVRQAREDHGWTQEALARTARVSRSWLARVEAGHSGAELAPLLRLMDALDLTLMLDPGSPTTPGQRTHTAHARTSARATAWGLQ